MKFRIIERADETIGVQKLDIVEASFYKPSSAEHFWKDVYYTHIEDGTSREVFINDFVNIKKATEFIEKQIAELNLKKARKKIKKVIYEFDSEVANEI